MRLPWGVIEVAKTDNCHYNPITMHKNRRYSLLKVKPAVVALVIWLGMYSHAAAGATSEVTLSPESGEIPWTILVAEQDKASSFNITAPGWTTSHPGYERAATDELASLIERMTGAKPEIVAVKDKSGAANYPRFIAIGRLAVEFGVSVPKSRFGVDGSLVDINADRILLAGETPMASYFAMTHLTEMAGCRWYMPESWERLFLIATS